MKISKFARKYYHLDKDGSVNYASAGNECAAGVFKELYDSDLALQKLTTGVKAAKVAMANGADPAKLLEWLDAPYGTPLAKEKRFNVDALAAELTDKFKVKQ